MEKKLKEILKTLKINESLISTIMGGVVIVVVGTLMINYFKSINKMEEIGSGADTELTQIVEGEKPGNLPVTYIVERGDNLWGIAEKFYKSGYNFVDIVSANQIIDANEIEIGTELTIPQVEVRKITVAEQELDEAVITIDGDSYTTVEGDHLWSIAVRAYGDGYAWTQIYEANHEAIGVNPGLIAKGMILSIPR